MYPLFCFPVAPHRRANVLREDEGLRMPIRMKDIATDLGVSVMTVSKVIRNHSDIGEDTRNRVLKRIKELGYTPNAAAVCL